MFSSAFLFFFQCLEDHKKLEVNECSVNSVNHLSNFYNIYQNYILKLYSKTHFNIITIIILVFKKQYFLNFTTIY